MMDLPIKTFKTPDAFEQWMEKNHTKPNGIWLMFYKKNSGIKSINYAEALDVALCYGWIDAQLKSFDEKAYLQRFTPRRSRSVWSKRNIEHIARLKKAGRMKPAGLAAVAQAKKNGQWDNAYHSSSTMVLPKEFLKELEKNKKVKENFGKLNQSSKYAIYFRLNSAKRPETKEKRLKAFIKILIKGGKINLF